MFDLLYNSSDANYSKKMIIDEINDTCNNLINGMSSDSISNRNKLNNICRNNILNTTDIYSDDLDSRVEDIIKLNDSEINTLSDKIKDFVLYVLYNYFCDGDTFNIERLRKTLIKTIEYYYNITI